ncbi:MAG TPA: ATP-binding protein [Methylomirabilota bacterium]|nr:ATP-binding protein [Methylomirabilota bacterium]
MRRRGWLTAVIAVAWLGIAGPAHAAPEHVSVLILLPGQPGLPAAAAIASGIRDVLLTDWALGVSIEMEHVDVARFNSADTEERRLRTLYGSKYGNQRFDVIIAALPEPFHFALRARDELWPGTPVVVCGVDERTVGDLKPPPGFAILTIRFDMEGTVRAALNLLPDTRHVALVGGASPPEQVYHDLIRRAVARAPGVDVIDLTKLPIAEALARVSSLPERTVVVQSSYQVDGAGRRFHGIDLVPRVSKAANRPVFTPLGLALGRGVVGGSILEFEDIGRDAGSIASRLMRGQGAPAAPVPSFARAMPRFDGRQLARWGLDEARLPEDSEVIFREPTLWQTYRWHVLGATALIVTQAALIVALLVQHRRRREAEAASRRLLGQIAHLDRVAGMSQLASSLAHELNQPLTAIRANAEAANRLLAASRVDLEELRACLADVISDDQRASEVIRRTRRMLQRTDFASVPIALNDLVASTLGLVANEALLRSVAIHFRATADLPAAYGDVVQIQQVILNLLTNAITAADSGGASPPTVAVWTMEASGGHVEVGVQDSGKGVAEADLQRIFEPFFTTKLDGLGMGLAISRTIVEAHGGRLTAENAPDGGAIFRIRLRAAERGAGAAKESTASASP